MDYFKVKNYFPRKEGFSVEDARREKVRVNLEETSYNTHVTPDELWRAVGEILLVQRTRRKWNHSDVERHGGPNYKTVASIELGKIGNCQKLASHCQALGLSVVDVLRAALERTATPITPEAAQLLRHFERISVPARQALLLVAQAYPNAEGESPKEHRPPGAPPDKGPRRT